MSAHSNVNLIEKQAREFKPKTVCLTNEEKANMFIVIKLNNNVVITSGEGTQINPYVVED